MMRAQVLLIFLTLFAAPAVGSRVLTSNMISERSSSEKGKHKCTITWRYRDQVASASFGVKSCRIYCSATTDFNHNKVFPLAFTHKQVDSKTCLCQANGIDVLRYPGECGDEPQKKCWNDYKILSTDSLEEQVGRDTLKVTHHHELYDEPTFKYDDIACEENGCADNKNCFTSELPPTSAGRSDAEKEAIGKLLKKIADGDVKEKDLDRDTKAIMDGLTLDDKEGAFFAALPKPRTVKTVKEFYDAKLDGLGISTDHLLVAAGFDPSTEEGLGQEVDEDSFKKFLKPDCLGSVPS